VVNLSARGLGDNQRNSRAPAKASKFWAARFLRSFGRVIAEAPERGESLLGEVDPDREDNRPPQMGPPAPTAPAYRQFRSNNSAFGFLDGKLKTFLLVW